jgi:hypothetical protein
VIALYRGVIDRNTVTRSDPLHPDDTRSDWRLVIAYRAIVRGAQHMVDCSAVFREWEQHGTVEDAHSTKHRPALDCETTPRRHHPRRPRQEPSGQRVSRAKSDGQIYPDRDEMRKLDRRFHCDQQTVRPVLALQPGIDLIAAWEAPAIRYLLPMAQDPPDKPPLCNSWRIHCALRESTLARPIGLALRVPLARGPSDTGVYPFLNDWAFKPRENPKNLKQRGAGRCGRINRLPIEI